MIGHHKHAGPAGQPGHHLIQIVVNYWETRASGLGFSGAPGPLSSVSARMGDARGAGSGVSPGSMKLLAPSSIGGKLDDLLRSGVSHVTTFVPWQVAEADISHALPRFIQAAAERRIHVSLIVTPEVGVHYPYSGLPKDLVSSVAACSIDSQPIVVGLPPNAFALPSLFAPEYTKRYQSFLSRIDGVLAVLGRSPGDLLRYVTVVTTGSFWKYYRSARRSSGREAYGAEAGDYSNAASLAYRVHLEQFYGQKEFSEGGPAAAARWKTRALEAVNRRTFHQLSEEVFRNRTAQLVRRKAADASGADIELYTPEADPAFAYTRWLQRLVGGSGEFARFSALLAEIAARASSVGGSAAAPFVHWTGLDAFRLLSEPERQFLVLKSLILLGGQGGGILIDETEWSAFSAAFRARVELFTRALAERRLRLPNRALYLVSHLWSAPHALALELLRQIGPPARLVASTELVVRETDARLLIVDPQIILTAETLDKLIAWARGGRVLALPRNPLGTNLARARLDSILALVAQGPSLDIDLGVAYRVHPLGEGRLVMYDAEKAAAAGVETGGEPREDSDARWVGFVTALRALADTESIAQLSDARLSLLLLDSGTPAGEGTGDATHAAFVVNPTSQAISVDLLFRTPCQVGDLVSDLRAWIRREEAQPDRPPGPELSSPALRFALEVPPCGFLSLIVKPERATEVGKPARPAPGLAAAAGAAPGRESRI